MPASSTLPAQTRLDHARQLLETVCDPEIPALTIAELGILRDIFADPAAYDIDAIFCETHEVFDAALAPEFDVMRRSSEALARPYLNLYWP